MGHMGEPSKLPVVDPLVKGVGVVKRPPSSLTSEDAEVKVPQRFYRRKSCQICCATTTAVILLLGLIILILSFTEFKVRDPVVKVTGMTLQSFSVSMDTTLTNFRLDVALHLNVSVYNPNIASFKYSNSSTFLYYRGREVGSALVPAGKVGAKKTERFETYLDIQALQIVMNANLTSDLQAGVIPINTYSAIRGTLNVINVFKHHAISTSDCWTNIVVSNQTLKDFNCVYKIKL
ncbi:unnamed protein product [Calypogeia fissa]